MKPNLKDTPNSWKELVPRKKHEGSFNMVNGVDLGQTRNGGYNQALTDSQPLYEYVEKLELALDEILEYRAMFMEAGEIAPEIFDIARKAREE